MLRPSSITELANEVWALAWVVSQRQQGRCQAASTFPSGGTIGDNPGSAGWTLSATPAVFWGQTGCGPRAKVNFCSFSSKISGSKSVGLFLIGWVALQPWFLMKCSHSNQDAWEVYLYVLTVNIKAYCKISSAFVSVVNLTQTGLNTAWTLFFWTTFYQTLEKSTMTSCVNYRSKSQIPVILELSRYTTDDNLKKKCLNIQAPNLDISRAEKV